MKEAIIDYKENNNLLSEEITTIKKSINNLKLTVIVEEIADETSIKSIEETDFQEEVQLEEPIIEETVVVEEPVVEELVIEENNEKKYNDEEQLSELSISETNEEVSNSSTSSEEVFR